MRATVLVLAWIAAASAQAPAPGAFEGKPALELANGRVRLTVLVQGASMAGVTLLDDEAKLNPLWNPARMLRELGQARPDNSGGTGHFVCVDGFGATSSEERAAGLQGHGEAHRQTFEIVRSARQGRESVLTMKAALPILHEIFTRTFRVVDGENVVYVESELESLLGFDRPAVWAEHATVGSPFLESGETVVDVSGARSRTRPYAEAKPGGLQLRQRLKSGVDFTWPMAPGLDGKPINLRLTPGEQAWLDHSATLIDPVGPHGWVTALHPGKRLILGYVFKREQYPWLQYWGNYPSTGKFARGLEFSTQPFDVPRREAITMGSMFGAPSYRWLPAKSKIDSQFLLFWARTPEGMRSIDAVKLENGSITIEDRTAGKRLTLAASRGI